MSRASNQPTTTRPVTLSTACRECDWSGLELLYRLQNGQPYETVPPGHVIDWNDPNVVRSFNVAAGTVTFVQEIVGGGGVGPHTVTVVVKVLLPTNAAADTNGAPLADGDALASADDAGMLASAPEKQLPLRHRMIHNILRPRFPDGLPPGIETAQLLQHIDPEWPAECARHGVKYPIPSWNTVNRARTTL